MASVRKWAEVSPQGIFNLMEKNLQFGHSHRFGILHPPTPGLQDQTDVPWSKLQTSSLRHGHLMDFQHCPLCVAGRVSLRGIQPFGVSGPHRKRESFLGPHIKYSAAHNHTKKYNELIYSFVLGAFTAILGCTWPVGHRLDAPGEESRGQSCFCKLSQPCGDL